MDVTLGVPGMPAPGTAELVALPFDPMALLDSLADAAPAPRPLFPEVEIAVRAWEAPPPADLGPAGAAWQATRDSVLALSDSLRQADPRSPGYPAAYGRFRALYRRLADRAAARDQALRGVTGEVRELARTAGRAADSLRRWEETAYAAFDSLAAARVAAAGREPVRAVLDHQGHAALELPPGAWWLTLRLRVGDSPFLERRWNVPVVSAAGLPFRVPLGAANSDVVWRH